ELGMGVTPWSPLRSGILSGKYTRDNAAKGVLADGRVWAAGDLNETAFAVIDELQRIARAVDSTVARVAIAWLQRRPGVPSASSGARRRAQLEDNLAAPALKLPAEHVARLDAITAPKPPFPAPSFDLNPALHHGGTTVNGEYKPIVPFIDSTRDEAY